jgi:hypothetical protein
MYLRQIVSYGNAWHDLREHFPSEFEEILSSINILNPENIANAKLPENFAHRQETGLTKLHLEACWTTAIESFGWNKVDGVIRSPSTRRIHLHGLGFTKNRISVSLQRHREILNRWLYTLAPFAIRNGFIDIPIAILLGKDVEEILFGRSPIMNSMLNRTMEELQALAPLSHNNPFLIISISLDDQGYELVELESESGAINRQIIINRSIEFPPEYHHAGLGILNYFGTVLREKYPDHNAKVKIEQEGLSVRLIVESENGDREVIEKALQEFEMVVRGEAAPEEFFGSAAKIIELKNELRIAQVRIDSQRELLAYQGQEVLSLRQLIGHSLTAKDTICIEVNPIINVTTSNAVQLQQNIPIISESVQELSALAITDPNLQLRLLDLDDSLNTLESKSANAIKEASGFKKLKKFLDEANETGTAVNSFIDNLDDGIGFLQKMASGYNAIAQWCGAPQVPTVLLGKNS